MWTRPVEEIVADTSVWIGALRGEVIPLLEEALKGGRVVLPPLVLAELLSGARTEKERTFLSNFLSYIPLHPVGRAHWKKTGLLRAKLLARGLTTSIPDCHIAQCSLETGGILLTRDKIFEKIARHVPLNVQGVSLLF